MCGRLSAFHRGVKCQVLDDLKQWLLTCAGARLSGSSVAGWGPSFAASDRLPGDVGAAHPGALFRDPLVGETVLSSYILTPVRKAGFCCKQAKPEPLHLGIQGW